MPNRIALFKAYYDEAMERSAIEVLRSGAIAVGKYNSLFTEKLSTIIHQERIVTTNDMSNAIVIALRLAGAGAGDEVITTPFACMSTNSPIAMVGAKPAWADVDPETATIDLESLKGAISKKTKALILYHVCGYPGPVADVAAFCRDEGIVLIEDCDNALLAEIDGAPVGAKGRFAIYSFYPNRQINASEGGALACRDSVDMERAIRLRRYGIDFSRFRLPSGEINPDCDIAEIGYAATLNNLCSALGFEQLGGVRARMDTTRKNARIYDGLFEGNRFVRPISPLPGASPSYWTYLIRTPQARPLLSHLKLRGIDCSQVHYLNTRYTGFRTVSPELRGSKELMESVLALPCGWWLDDGDIERVFEEVNAFFLAGDDVQK